MSHATSAAMSEHELTLSCHLSLSYLISLCFASECLHNYLIPSFTSGRSRLHL